MMRKRLLQGSGDGLWGGDSKRQECWTSATESNAPGAGRIARGNSLSHAGDKGGTVRLVQTVVHGCGQEIIMLTVQSVHQQGNAATVKDGIGSAHLGWQDSAGLRGRELEVRNGYDEGEFRREWELQIAVLSLSGIR